MFAYLEFGICDLREALPEEAKLNALWIWKVCSPCSKAQPVTELNAEAHHNALFKHYYYFVMEFDLMEARELEPLQDLIDRICKD